MLQSYFLTDVEAEQQTVKRIASSESTISSKNNGNPRDIENAADRGRDGHDDKSGEEVERATPDEVCVPSNEEPPHNLAALSIKDTSDPIPPATSTPPAKRRKVEIKTSTFEVADE